MMRATARNFAGILANDRPSMLEAAFDCDYDVADFMIADTWWYTSSRDRFDIMYTTFMGQSWQAPCVTSDVSPHTSRVGFAPHGRRPAEQAD